MSCAVSVSFFSGVVVSIDRRRRFVYLFVYIKGESALSQSVLNHRVVLRNRNARIINILNLL